MRRNSSSSSLYRAILVSAFRTPRRKLFLPKARLFRDRICLTGWSLDGRYEAVIMLADVSQVDWWSAREDANLTICVDGGERFDLWVSGPGNWKFAIESRIGQAHRRETPRLPRSTTEERTAA